MRSYKFILLLGQASAMALSAPAAAQDNAAGIADGDIIVTAQRRTQALSDVGMSISAISADTLVNRNITRAEDLSKLVAGLSVSDSGYATPIYTLRGVGINEPSIGSSSSVAVYVDEVPLAYPVTTQGAALDLQRVEVLKGPQGTLYGQNSTGGAINYIANKPTEDFSAALTGTAGRFNRASIEGFVSGPLAPGIKARLAGRASVGGGWQRSFTRDDKLGRVRNFTGRAIVDLDPSDNLHISANLNGWIDRSDTIAPQLVARTPANPGNASPQLLTAPLAPANARQTDWDSGLDFDRDDSFWQGSVRAQLALSDTVSLTSITSYTHLKRNQFSDQDGIDAPVLRNLQRGTIKSLAQEVRFAAEFGGLNWVVGANVSDDATDETVRQELPLSSQVRPLSSGGGIRAAQKINSWAVFTNIDLPITRQLSVTGGVRLSEETRKFHGCGFILDAASTPLYTTIVNGARARNGLAPLPPLVAGQCYSIYNSAAAAALDTAGLPALVPGEAHRRLKQDNVPWNINLNFKPTTDSLVYARVSRGYKAGNFATLASTDLGAYSPIVQEKLTAYELGARAVLSRALRVEAAIFRYDYIDKQLRARRIDPVLGNINAQTNIPKSRLKGAEASITVAPVRNLSIAFSGTYIKSRILRYTGFTIDATGASPLRDFAGSRFNFTPKYSVNADLNYKHPLSGTLDAVIGVNYAYRSKTQAVFSPPGYALLGNYDIDSYALVDGQLGVEGDGGKWKAWLWGKNIFNKYYWTNVVKVSDVTVKYPGMPVSYGVAASIRF